MRAEVRNMARPPVAVGCGAAILAILGVVLAFVFFVVFLNGGSESSTVTLANADSYAPGSVTYNGDHRVYIVRMQKGEFIILADLDAANEASTTRKCRVQPIKTDDPQFLAMVKQYTPKMSTEAQSMPFLFREACNGAVYDITGLRLDSGGPNLARYASSIDPSGKLVVDLRSKHCSIRSSTSFFAPTACVAAG